MNWSLNLSIFQMLIFPLAVIRGALMNLGIQSIVSAEVGVPQCRSHHFVVIKLELLVKLEAMKPWADLHSLAMWYHVGTFQIRTAAATSSNQTSSLSAQATPPPAPRTTWETYYLEFCYFSPSNVLLLVLLFYDIISLPVSYFSHHKQDQWSLALIESQALPSWGSEDLRL